MLRYRQHVLSRFSSHACCLQITLLLVTEIKEYSSKEEQRKDKQHCKYSCSSMITFANVQLAAQLFSN